MMASGAAAMGYEIVWTRQSAMWLGHESAAVLAVVAAFFGGLALGGLLLGARIEATARPVRWYAGCELSCALWSLVLVFAAPPLSGWVLRLTGVAPSAGWQWAVAFCTTFLLLLPATAAMGATLPAMERLAAAAGNGAAGRSIAGLYASNTLGSVLGVLAAALWLIPGIGLQRSAAICIALDVACAAIALGAFRRALPRARAPHPIADRILARRAMQKLAVTGFLGIGYEVVVVRVLSQVTEDTVYTFAMLLAVYLAGTAAGAAAYQRYLVHRDRDRLGDRLLAALASACLAGTASLWAAARIKAWALGVAGPGVAAAVAVEAWLAVLAFGLPTIAMGAVFSHLSRAASDAGLGFGRALGVNTLAAAAAPAACGVVAIPALGPKAALLLIAAGYLAAASRRAWTAPSTWIPALAALALAVFAPPLRFVDVPDGGRIVSYQDGAMAAVSVVEDAAGVATLRIDNRQQEGSSATRRVDARLAWLPLLLHPAPHRALFLGLGTGVTAASAAEDPALDVDAVELLPEVIAASPRFVPGAPRLRVLAADARRYVRASDRAYDVIVADNFHPARSGSAALYTVEHFDAVRRRLAAGGVFCQWLPVHQLDLATLRSIVRSFVAVYPTSWAMIASNSLDTPVLGLVARRDPQRFELPAVRDRLSRAAATDRLAGLGLEDELAVLGGMAAGPAALARFASGAPPNTDDHPIVAYTAPRATYAPEASPRDRLIALLGELSLAPDELIAATDGPTDAASRDRLAAYWAARNRFIASGRDVRPSPRVTDMLAQVREPLLAILRISPDFRPAYDPLLAMAAALARSDRPGARALLGELQQVQPARSEAIRMLATLAAEH